MRNNKLSECGAGRGGLTGRSWRRGARRGGGGRAAGARARPRPTARASGAAPAAPPAAPAGAPPGTTPPPRRTTPLSAGTTQHMHHIGCQYYQCCSHRDPGSAMFVKPCAT